MSPPVHSCLAQPLKIVVKRFSHSLNLGNKRSSHRTKNKPSYETNTDHKYTCDLYIPFEVASEILSRLPTKDVIRYKCVCKAWRHVIQTPEFIKSHTVKANYNTNSYLLFYDWLSPCCERFCLDFCSGSSQLELKKLPPLPLIPKGFHQPVGSCNGLLCLYEKNSETNFRRFWIYNIATASLHITPYQISIPDQTIKHRFNFGFGYDSTSDDYKILCFLRFFHMGDVMSFSESWVYSLKNNSWKAIQTLHHYICLSDSIRCVPNIIFSNNALHWINRKRNCITFFQLGTEMYYEMVFPPASDLWDPYLDTLELINLRGCLHLVRYRWHNEQTDYYEMEIWVMTKYQVQWTKLIRINLRAGSFPIPVPFDSVPPLPYAYSKDGKEILIASGSPKTLICCELDSGKLKLLKIPGVRHRYLLPMTLDYFSLVSPSPS